MQARVMVKMFLPFTHVEDKDVRLFHAGLMSHNESPTPPMSAEDVKHVMLEMYSATKAQETGKLRALADKACLPFLHLNVDKWDGEGSGRSFLGARVFWVEDWQLRRATLAVSTYGVLTMAVRGLEMHHFTPRNRLILRDTSSYCCVGSSIGCI